MTRFLAIALALLSLPSLGAQVRIKELADVQGMRENALFGYGLVVGLSGTGDTERVFFTSQSIAGMLGRLGIRVDPRDIHARNVAAVIVTARLPTFSRPGAHLDITVSAMGDARSLSGGVLLVTPLAGADGTVYAVGQGPLQVGGYEAGAAGSLVRKNQTTTGLVPAGATVEKAVTPNLGDGPLVLALKSPDFTNASRMAAAVEASLGQGSAKALDAAAVEVTVPENFKQSPVALIAKLEELRVESDARAKVVVNERTGTVVAGEQVRLRPAAISHGGLQVSISQRPVISQPSPFAQQGSTVSRRVADVQANEISRTAVSVPATSTVDELVKALNTIGANSRDLVSILQALKAVGSLDADLEII